MFPPQNNAPPPGPPMQPGMPPQAGPPPQPGQAQGQDGRALAMQLKQKLPPKAAAMIDENNPLQIQVLERFAMLAPEEIAALSTIDRPAMMALKKVVPEAYVMLVLVKVSTQGRPGMAPPMQGGAPGGPPGAGAPMPPTTGPAAQAEMQGMEAQAAPPRPPMPPQMRPQTALGRVG